MVRLLVVACLVVPAHGCTNIAFGRLTTADGSTIAASSVDSGQADSRMAYIPPRDHPAGTMRPVYLVDGNYPRFVGNRSRTYAPVSVDGVMQDATQPMGHIPEARHTYGYWENTYPYMNEKGLAFGESTSMGRISAAAKALGGPALFSVEGLMQLALERCADARCAIETMGHWGEREGFYGEDTHPSDAGEMLTVVDGSEGWVFHIMADFDGGAVWAAQRVPDSHVAVMANNFILRGIDFSDDKHSDFMWSAGLLKTSRELVGRGVAPASCGTAATFDFLRCFGADLRVEWYNPGYGAPVPNPWYTTQRMWRVQRLVAPSIARFEEPTDNAFDLPFSFPADTPLTVGQIMDIMRDKYEGTDFDLTQGAMAGPYGDPNRNEGGEGLAKVSGKWPRAISLLRTICAIVCHSRHGAPDTLWLSMHQPATSVFVPFFAESTTCHESFMRGSQGEYDDASAWWTFSFVGNFMRLNWRLTSSYVTPKRNELQADLLDRASRVVGDFDSEQTAWQRRVIDEWKSLGRFVVMLVNNGYDNVPTLAGGYGYPEEWLKAIGFRQTLLPIWVQPATEMQHSHSEWVAVATFLIGLTLGTAIAAFMLRRRFPWKGAASSESHYCAM